MIDQIDSARWDDSNGANIVDLCLPVKKLLQLLQKLWCVKIFFDLKIKVWHIIKLKQITKFAIILEPKGVDQQYWNR